MTTLRIGVTVALSDEPEATIAKVRLFGLHACQVTCWDQGLLAPQIAGQLRERAEKAGVDIATLWTGYPSEPRWNLVEGPSTVGLVPPQNRDVVLEALMSGSDFARWAGIPSITTHVGFIPENPADPVYLSLLDSLKALAAHCAGNGQSFWFETGQETPVTLLRTIEDIGAQNVGVNFDPANLLAYGKGNPLDALDLLGPYVRGVHVKDGLYPVNGRQLGKEKPLGEGRVDFPAILAKLREIEFDGILAIEREISGPRQIEDIRIGIAFLEEILTKAEGL